MIEVSPSKLKPAAAEVYMFSKFLFMLWKDGATFFKCALSFPAYLVHIEGQASPSSSLYCDYIGFRMAINAMRYQQRSCFNQKVTENVFK